MAAQPDFVVLGQHLAGAAAEIILVPNIPPGPPLAGIQNQLNQIMNQLAQLGVQFGGMQDQIGGMQGQINDLQGQIGGMQGQIGGMQGQINDLQGQIGGMQGQIGGMQGQIGGMQGQLNRLEAGQDLLPIRLQNATASLDAPLRYPVVIQEAQAPRTKQQLLSLTAANCQLVALALNLAMLPNNATVVQRRQQILDYLGCGVIAH